jgi:hypothetical protein
MIRVQHSVLSGWIQFRWKAGRDRICSRGLSQMVSRNGAVYDRGSFLLCFLSAFRVCFAPLRETESSENEFRAKRRAETKGAKGN